MGVGNDNFIKDMKVAVNHAISHLTNYASEYKKLEEYETLMEEATALKAELDEGGIINQDDFTSKVTWLTTDLNVFFSIHNINPN